MNKNVGGRPTDYKPDLCDQAIEVLSQAAGIGICELAAALNVTERTILNWRKQHPEFAEAVQIGLTKSKALFLQQARKNTISTKFENYNTPLFIRLMQRVYHDSDCAAVEIEGWNKTKSLEEKFELITAALGNGEITTDQADKFANVLTKHMQATELAEIKARLNALEGA